ncbi:hypothetical protein CBE01nite_39190 [Clostridium beijerinckii]|jgi:hypothetical protein|nr:tellurite resistance-related uncharacterized protein [Clostridium beijerinckii]NYB95297.1 tellurite resistance-related uncharacterized protein [Clostridium beijerinckii]OOM20580.1 hypothetical protein CLBEI_43220 [Clostridium beijerinckii]GEP66151.1 hypothetical protein CBE01nite_39190 [Clostridium beijerinckii]SQB00441.1 Uncharacterised protein [Clostridium beijerinckii]
MVVILRLEVVPNMLVQSLSLKLAFWAQLLVLESPIKFLRNWNKSMLLISVSYKLKCGYYVGYL